MRKFTLRLLFALALCLTLLPGKALAASGGVYVGTTLLTEAGYYAVEDGEATPEKLDTAPESAGYVYYNGAGGLTLHNVALTKCQPQGAYSGVIFSKESLHLTLEGENRIQAPDRDTEKGISVTGGSLTVTGEGSLTVAGIGADAQGDSAALYACPNEAGNGGEILLRSGTIQALGWESGLDACQVEITGGSLTAEGGSYGIYLYSHAYREAGPITISGGQIDLLGGMGGILISGELAPGMEVHISGEAQGRIRGFSYGAISEAANLPVTIFGQTYTGKDGLLTFGNGTYETPPAVRELYVNGVNLLRQENYSLTLEGGSAVFDPETNTLTLHNMEITQPGGGWPQSGVHAQGDLTLQLSGDNTIRGVSPDEGTTGDPGMRRGLYASEDLVILGDKNASLEVEIRGPGAEGGISAAALRIQDVGSVTAKTEAISAVEADSLDVEGCCLDAQGSGMGISFIDSLRFSNSEINAQGQSVGIGGGRMIEAVDSILTAWGQTYSGVSAEKLTISGTSSGTIQGGAEAWPMGCEVVLYGAPLSQSHQDARLDFSPEGNSLYTRPTVLLVNGMDILTAPDHTVACGEGSAHYDPETGTLTLTDAAITAAGRPEDWYNAEEHAAIWCNGDLHVVLLGESQIDLSSCPNQNSPEHRDFDFYCLSGHSLDFSGTGSLTEAGQLDSFLSGNVSVSGTAALDMVALHFGGQLLIRGGQVKAGSISQEEASSVLLKSPGRLMLTAEQYYFIDESWEIESGTIENQGNLVMPSGTTPAEIAALQISGDGCVWVDEVKYHNDGTLWEEGGDTDTPSEDEGGSPEAPPADNGGSTATRPSEKEPAAAPEASAFRDVAADDWFYEAVCYVQEMGLMDGMGDGTFAPQTALSRAMLARLLYNLEGQPAVDGGNRFGDLTADWYIDAVNWAASLGLVSGYGDGSFRPDQDISRQEMVQMLYHYARYKGYDLSGSYDLSAYRDGGKTADWAREAMAWALAQGIVSGKGGSTLDPEGSATRAEIAQLLQNFLENDVA